MLHLDKLPYYQFAYPSGNLFRQTVDTPDGTTQFAPYVMLNGRAVNIYVIEQNDVPCYFSWTEQPKQYSFPVLHPSGKQKIMLRMHDRAFIIDSLAFDRGKKTILSFDMNQLPQGVEVVWLRQRKGKYDEYKFTSEEKKRYERYLCRLPVMDGAVYTSLKHNGNAVSGFTHGAVALQEKDIGRSCGGGTLEIYEWCVVSARGRFLL